MGGTPSKIVDSLLEDTNCMFYLQLEFNLRTEFTNCHLLSI